MKRKLKIVQVIPNLGNGGAERFVVDLSNTLSKNPKLEVLLISLYNNKGSSLVNLLCPDVQFVELGKRIGFDLKVFFRIISILNHNRPDVVHTHLNALEYVLCYCIFKRTKCYHTLHTDAFKEIQIWPIRKIRWLLFKIGSIVPITISSQGSLSFRQCYNLDNDVMIENGRSNMQPSERINIISKELNDYKGIGGYLLINVARITPAKNHQVLINAIQLLHEESINVNLIIIGGSREPNDDYFLKLKEQECEYIRFLGPKWNVFDYLLCADAFCLSSTYEGMPISIIEAFQAGCIPICTPVGGIPDMIRNGENGFLSSDVSAESLAVAIMEFINLPDKELMRSRCKIEFYRRYNIEEVSNNYLRVYGAIN